MVPQLIEVMMTVNKDLLSRNWLIFWFWKWGKPTKLWMTPFSCDSFFSGQKVFSAERMEIEWTKYHNTSRELEEILCTDLKVWQFHRISWLLKISISNSRNLLGLRSSTCPLTSSFWLLSHVIYLKLTKVL